MQTLLVCIITYYSSNPKWYFKSNQNKSLFRFIGLNKKVPLPLILGEKKSKTKTNNPQPQQGVIVEKRKLSMARNIPQVRS